MQGSGGRQCLFCLRKCCCEPSLSIPICHLLSRNTSLQRTGDFSCVTCFRCGTRELWDELLGTVVRSEQEVHLPTWQRSRWLRTHSERHCPSRNRIPETSAIADASRRRGTDGKPDTDRTSFARYETSDLSCAKSSTTGGYSHDGKAPTFTGEQKDWPEWSFKFTVCVILANLKSIGAPRWAAIEESLHQGGCALPCHCCAKEAPW